jgi:hypothetical protein
MSQNLIEKLADSAGINSQTKITREHVISLENQILNLPQLDLRVEHHFSEGVYARELHIPAGTILTGKIHKFTNLNILSKGEISVLSENGIERVTAPFTVVSPPGTKRVAYTHTDCVWTTIHGTYEQDLDKIEEIFTTNNEQEYLAFVESLVIENK